MDIINDELNKLRKLMGVHEKGLPHLLWMNKEGMRYFRNAEKTWTKIFDSEEDMKVLYNG